MVLEEIMDENWKLPKYAHEMVNKFARLFAE